MNIELLKTFLEVSRTKHFGRAAEILCLTQSAVSFRVRKLETQLGVSLFTRYRHNIRLTAAGEKLLPYAENLMLTWQVAKQKVEVTQSLQQDWLSVGASASLWEAWLGEWLLNIYQTKPSLRLEARVALPLHQGLIKEKEQHKRQLDLLITTEAPKIEELTSQELGSLSLTLFTAGATFVSGQRPYIQLEWGADFHYYESRLLVNFNQQAPLMITSSAQLTRQLLPATGACAFLPSHWVHNWPDLQPISEVPSVIRPLYAVWLQNSDQRPLIRQLLKTPII
ncbi:transcriptional regulator HdfR [Candidatus Palibaumannia cicadellinicola]|uniref:Transcriptional regulator HdfR n=1 Tax=Candidatus Palibaumannia cicadellinicola TaxID=186490 RepID=A0A2N4XXQ8_9GAMM|nr:HTH-type transcriptional regulator HdfR [Candidatus Baumannia cicadellinicola]PLK59410.1 transcriptional regulator HdfR [Candidatus Baumannia cicadellinicola]